MIQQKNRLYKMGKNFTPAFAKVLGKTDMARDP